MLAFFATLVEQHAHTYDSLTLERNNILAALRVAPKASMRHTFAHTVNAFAPFLEMRGEYVESGHLLKLAEEAAIACDDAAAIAQSRLYSGRLAELHGEYQQALNIYKSGLDASARAHDEQLGITLLARCAEVALRCGNSMDAERLAQEGLERAHALGNRLSVAGLLRTVAQAAGNRGDLAVGDELYPEALALADEVGDVETAISCLQNMGTIAFKRGQFKQAVSHLRNGLERAKAVGHVRRVAALQNALGCVYVRLASTPEEGRRERYTELATQMLEACLRLATAYQLPQWLNNALQNLGALERGRKRYALAEQYLEQARGLAQTLGDRWLIAETECEMGELYLDMGKQEEAQMVYEKVLEVATEGGDTEMELVALANYGLGRVWAAKEKISKAREYGMISLQYLSTLQFEREGEVREWLNTLASEHEGRKTCSCTLRPG